MPSELTITEDNREIMLNNFATFVASKKIHGPANEKQVQSIERRIQLCEQVVEPVNTVICTGFNCQAPKLVFSKDRLACRGVLDTGNKDP